MEILKKTSKSGRVYRIYKEFSSWDLYVIEWLQIGKCDDGSDFKMWNPAYEPKNKVFTSAKEAQVAFEAFLQN
jgi:hypothetical protein